MVEPPAESEAVFQVWVEAPGWTPDCFEFSAPDDLLGFSNLTPARLYLIQAHVAEALFNDSIHGHWSRNDLGQVLKDGRLSLRLGGKALAWDPATPFDSFDVSGPRARSARLDETLPSPAPQPFKPPRF